MIDEQKYQQLLAENKAQQEEILLLRTELANIKKLIFGSKRERHIPQTEGQGSLFSTTPAKEKQQEKKKPAKQPDRKKKAGSPPQSKGFPAHLKRVEERLEVENLPEDAKEIGADITELLAYQEGYFYVRRIVRPRLASKTTEKVYQENIPERLIPKGKLDESVIAQLIVEKIYLHLPVHRFAKKMKMFDSEVVSINTLQNGFHRAAEAMRPLYHLLGQEIQSQSYLQVDETPLKVLNNKGKKKESKGYMWIYRAPATGAVLFDYNPGRNKECPQKLLADYKGYLQVDGYGGYDQYRDKKDITLLHCMAHARRKFIEAKDYDERTACWFLDRATRLYAIERQAREDKLTTRGRYRLRQKEALPILKEIENWLEKNLYTHPPKTPIAKAIAYTHSRWARLCLYANDGQLEIDNNLIENKVRPLALGRKNYLFAHNEHTAQNLAMLYSLIGTCEACSINPHKYITWILKKIVHHKIDDSARDWLPQHIDPKLL